MKSFDWIAFTFSLILILGFSLSANAETEFGYWVGIFPHYKINETQNLSLQAEYREIQNNQTGLFRPSYHYKLSNVVTLGMGYDLFEQKTKEERLWPELAGHIPVSSLGVYLIGEFVTNSGLETTNQKLEKERG